VHSRGPLGQFRAQFGDLVVFAGLALGEPATLGDPRVPLGQELVGAVHGGSAGLGFLPEVVLDQPAVGAVRASGQQPFHRLAQSAGRAGGHPVLRSIGPGGPSCVWVNRVSLLV
jgi:hypothetical protein